MYSSPSLPAGRSLQGSKSSWHSFFCGCCCDKSSKKAAKKNNNNNNNNTTTTTTNNNNNNKDDLSFLNSVRSFLHNMLSIPFHLKRATFYDLTSEMATDNEKKRLNRVLGVTQRGTLNLLAWRKSTLNLAAVGTLACAYFQLNDCFDSHGTYLDVLEVATQNVTYDAGGEDAADLSSYTERVVKACGASAMRDVMLIRYWSSWVLFALTCLALLSIFAALKKWDHYHTSRKFMLLAWLLAFAAPFAISTIPTRQFVNWDMFGFQTSAFIRGVSIHFQLDVRQAQLVEACVVVSDPDNPATLEQARSNVDTMCSAFDDLDGGFINWLSGDMISQANENCRLAQQALNDGNVDLALQYSSDACSDVLNTVDEANEANQTLIQKMQVMLITQDMIKRARTAAELTLALSNALYSVQSMFPAAVAIAPALLRGALTVKTLVPQSSIPGMFVILLPWLCESNPNPTSTPNPTI